MAEIIRYTMHGMQQAMAPAPRLQQQPRDPRLAHLGTSAAQHCHHPAASSQHG
jgi:hypothetical protein